MLDYCLFLNISLKLNFKLYLLSISLKLFTDRIELPSFQQILLYVLLFF